METSSTNLHSPRLCLNFEQSEWFPIHNLPKKQIPHAVKSKMDSPWNLEWITEVEPSPRWSGCCVSIRITLLLCRLGLSPLLWWWSGGDLPDERMTDRGLPLLVQLPAEVLCDPGVTGVCEDVEVSGASGIATSIFVVEKFRDFLQGLLWWIKNKKIFFDSLKIKTVWLFCRVGKPRIWMGFELGRRVRRVGWSKFYLVNKI